MHIHKKKREIIFKNDRFFLSYTIFITRSNLFESEVLDSG
jgi:hypothetical protein